MQAHNKNTPSRGDAPKRHQKPQEVDNQDKENLNHESVADSIMIAKTVIFSPDREVICFSPDPSVQYSAADFFADSDDDESMSLENADETLAHFSSTNAFSQNIILHPADFEADSVSQLPIDSKTFSSIVQELVIKYKETEEKAECAFKSRDVLEVQLEQKDTDLYEHEIMYLSLMLSHEAIFNAVSEVMGEQAYANRVDREVYGANHKIALSNLTKSLEISHAELSNATLANNDLTLKGSNMQRSMEELKQIQVDIESSLSSDCIVIKQMQEVILTLEAKIVVLGAEMELKATQANEIYKESLQSWTFSNSESTERINQLLLDSSVSCEKMEVSLNSKNEQIRSLTAALESSKIDRESSQRTILELRALVRASSEDFESQISARVSELSLKLENANESSSLANLALYDMSNELLEFRVNASEAERNYKAESKILQDEMQVINENQKNEIDHAIIIRESLEQEILLLKSENLEKKAQSEQLEEMNVQSSNLLLNIEQLRAEIETLKHSSTESITKRNELLQDCEEKDSIIHTNVETIRELNRIIGDLSDDSDDKQTVISIFKAEIQALNEISKTNNVNRDFQRTETVGHIRELETSLRTLKSDLTCKDNESADAIRKLESMKCDYEIKENAQSKSLLESIAIVRDQKMMIQKSQARITDLELELAENKAKMNDNVAEKADFAAKFVSDNSLLAEVILSSSIVVSEVNNKVWDIRDFLGQTAEKCPTPLCLADAVSCLHSSVLDTHTLVCESFKTSREQHNQLIQTHKKQLDLQSKLLDQEIARFESIQGSASEEAREQHSRLEMAWKLEKIDWTTQNRQLVGQTELLKKQVSSLKAEVIAISEENMFKDVRTPVEVIELGGSGHSTTSVQNETPTASSSLQLRSRRLEKKNTKVPIFETIIESPVIESPKIVPQMKRLLNESKGVIGNSPSSKKLKTIVGVSLINQKPGMTPKSALSSSIVAESHAGTPASARKSRQAKAEILISFSGFKEGTIFDNKLKRELNAAIKLLPDAAIIVGLFVSYVGPLEGASYDKRITHVIQPSSCRTIKTFGTVLCKRWLISNPKWVLDSMKAGKWLPEYDYGYRIETNPLEGKKIFTTVSFNASSAKTFRDGFLKCLLVDCSDGKIVDDEKDCDMVLKGDEDAHVGKNVYTWGEFLALIPLK